MKATFLHDSRVSSLCLNKLNAFPYPSLQSTYCKTQKAPRGGKGFKSLHLVKSASIFPHLFDHEFLSVSNETTIKEIDI